MIPDGETWIRCSEPGWELQFSHPPTDGAGRQVTVERTSRGTSIQRVHATAEDKDEIYFEVVRYSEASTSDIYSSMEKQMPGLYPSVVFEPLRADGDLSVGGFSWADQRRSVHFTELPEATYRIILRPHAPANLAILSTVVTEE